MRRQVEAMAAFGVPELNIARVVGIDAKTLRKHYREELDTGQTKATAKVAESLFRKATSEGPQSVTAAIFWLKTRGGWRETSVHEIAGPNQQPIEIDISVTQARDLLQRRLTEVADRLPAPLQSPGQANVKSTFKPTT
jgi:hypothetical protein